MAYFSFMASSKGTRIAPSKTTDEENWTAQGNISDLRIFLAFASLYRHFIMMLLGESLKTPANFVWQEAQQLALENLREANVHNTQDTQRTHTVYHGTMTRAREKSSRDILYFPIGEAVIMTLRICYMRRVLLKYLLI